MNSRSLVNCFVWSHQYSEKSAKKQTFLGCPENFTIGLCTKLPLVVVHCWTSVCILNWFWGGLRLFSDVWSENDALFKRLMKIHWNPPIQYFGFNFICFLFVENSFCIRSQSIFPWWNCYFETLLSYYMYNSYMWLYVWQWNWFSQKLWWLNGLTIQIWVRWAFVFIRVLAGISSVIQW